MRNENKFNINFDLSEVIFSVLIFLLIILCVGEPDLLDAIIQRVMKG